MTETKGEYEVAQIKEGDVVWHKDYGRGIVAEVPVGVIHILVKFDEIRNLSTRHAWVSTKYLTTTPPLPEGYQPASQPPINGRDVMVLLDDGSEQRGWHGRNTKVWFSHKKEYLLGTSGDNRTLEIDPATIVGWRELR